jgi:DNA polymerase-3 subunit delta'
MISFGETIGQHDVKSRLIRSFSEGKLAHALLLHGPEGNGALSLALSFCRYIACASRTASDACGHCNTCRKFASIQFADLHFTFPFFNKQDNKATVCNDYARQWRDFLLKEGLYGEVENWRRLLDAEKKQLHVSVYEAGSIMKNLSLKAYEGGYKFQVIWRAEYLRRDTANKLLKIVEEPPANTLFIFIADNVENVLPTILSRVQTLHVPAIADNDVAAALEAAGIESARAEGIAHYCAGNWNLALQLAGSSDPHAFLAQQFQLWMRYCFKRSVSELVRWCDSISALHREEQVNFLDYALEQVRQNVVINYVGGSLARMNALEQSFSEKFAPFINHLNIEDLYSEINRARSDIGRQAYSKLVFFDLSLKVHHLLSRKEPA